MNRSTIITLFLLLFLAGSGCKKCYDCTKKCGTCQKSGYSAAAGCQGDTTLHGLSVEAWKVYYESNGYTCAYSNAVESVCCTDNKLNCRTNIMNVSANKSDYNLLHQVAI